MHSLKLKEEEESDHWSKRVRSLVHPASFTYFKQQLLSIM